MVVISSGGLDFLSVVVAIIACVVASDVDADGISWLLSVVELVWMTSTEIGI